MSDLLNYGLATLLISCIVASILWIYRKASAKRSDIHKLVIGQVSFDKEYLNERKKLTLDPKEVELPLFFNKSKAFSSTVVDKDVEAWDWFSELENKIFPVLIENNYTFYSSLIVSLYDQLKDFNSKISQAFFKKRITVLEFKDANVGPELREKVKNILEAVESYKFLSKLEIQKISQYFYQIFIDNLNSGNIKRVNKFKAILESYLSPEHVDYAFKSMWLPVVNFDFALLFYYSLSNELSMPVKIYDFIEDASSSCLKGKIEFNCNLDTEPVLVLVRSNKTYIPCLYGNPDTRKILNK